MKRGNILNKWLELIGVDRTLNIGMAVLTIAGIILWRIFRWDGLVTCGIYLSLYWALFFWLQMVNYKKVKGEVIMGNIRSKLQESSRETLIREILKGGIRFNLLEAIFAIYSLGVVWLLCKTFGVTILSLNWIVILSIGISWVYLIYGSVRTAAYIVELIRFNRELLEPVEICTKNSKELKTGFDKFFDKEMLDPKFALGYKKERCEMDLKQMEIARVEMEKSDERIRKEEIDTFCNLSKIKHELDDRDKQTKRDTVIDGPRDTRVRF
jgi:hypothetical protein